MTWASAGLTSHLSISYLLAELFELLVHKLGSPKCVVVGISVCSNIYFIKRIAKWKKGISLIPPPFTTAEIPLAAIWQKTTDKKWKFQILVSTCSWAAAQAGTVYQLQDRSWCRMRYLHYPTLKNTRSFIKRIAKQKKKGFFQFLHLLQLPWIRPSRNLAEKKLTKNENSKFWSQRVPERQHMQGLPTARSQFV